MGFLHWQSLADSLRWDDLCNAWYNTAIFDHSLDQPMFISMAGSTAVHASLAKIEVTVLTDAAMVMLVGNGVVARVAIDTKDVA